MQWLCMYIPVPGCHTTTDGNGWHWDTGCHCIKQDHNLLLCLNWSMQLECLMHSEIMSALFKRFNLTQTLCSVISAATFTVSVLKDFVNFASCWLNFWWLLQKGPDCTKHNSQSCKEIPLGSITQIRPVLSMLSSQLGLDWEIKTWNTNSLHIVKSLVLNLSKV